VNLRRTQGLLAGAFFLLLSLAFSWPLPLHLGSRIAAHPPLTDPAHLLYAVTTGARNLARDPFHYFDATFFYPYRSTLSFLDQTAGVTVLAAPFDWLTGNMFLGYNAAWILTFVLSGTGAFLLARHVTGSALGGLLAGVLFAFHPFRYHNAGIISVLAMMWIPFIFLFLHRWVETGGRRHLVAAAFFAVLQFLCTAYTGVFLILSVLLYVLVLVALDRRRFLERVKAQRWTLVAAMVVGGAVLVPFVLPYFHNLRAHLGMRRGLGDAALYAARLPDFLTPAPGSLLRGLAPWGAAARHPLFPGVVALGLGLFWALTRGWRGHPRRTELIFYALLLILGLVLSLGPAYPVGDHWIPLPFALIHYAVPGASFVRSPVRFVILASLALSVLAAAGLARLLGSPGRRRPGRRLTGWALIGAAAVELFAAPLPLFDPFGGEIPGVYRWLAAEKTVAAVIELPMPVEEKEEKLVNVRYQLYSLLHGKRLANGVGGYVPPITRRLRTEMQSFPDAASVAELDSLGIGTVIVHSDRYPPAGATRLRRAIEADPRLSLREWDGGIWVVTLDPKGAPARRAGETTNGG
jgi:hypothetical protein